MNKVAEIVTKIRAYAEQSAACQEMAVDTADNAARAAEFAAQGEEINNGYATAIEYIEAGNYADAADALEGIRRLEAAGGDDQYARRALVAIETLTADDSSKFTIEGLADGTWCREHVGANESNLFDSREDAEAELDGLARALECDVSELRVVEMAGNGL